MMSIKLVYIDEVDEIQHIQATVSLTLVKGLT